MEVILFFQMLSNVYFALSSNVLSPGQRASSSSLAGAWRVSFVVIRGRPDVYLRAVISQVSGAFGIPWLAFVSLLPV